MVVHPGTARPEKYWVPERWARVIDFCQNELGRRCVLTGGRGDRMKTRIWRRIRAALASPCADLSGELDLLTLTAVLAAAGLVLGVDSGPMHLGRRRAVVRRSSCSVRQIRSIGDPGTRADWCCRRATATASERPGDFTPRSARAPVDAISTDAVIACIRNLPPPAAWLRPGAPVIRNAARIPSPPRHFEAFRFPADAA